MTRERLPDRRPNETFSVAVRLMNEREVKVLVTVGYEVITDPATGDKVRGRAKEMFCADFKAGSEVHGMIMDACVLMSRLLQYGDTPEGIYLSLGRPVSIIGQIAAAVAGVKP